MINPETLTDIADRIHSTGALDESVINQLRQSFDGVHFTYCSDDDISDITPVAEHATFNLYLVNGHDHCLTMTKDFNAATGIVVAEVYPE